jgi:hypothetical protein
LSGTLIFLNKGTESPKAVSARTTCSPRLWRNKSKKGDQLGIRPAAGGRTCDYTEKFPYKIFRLKSTSKHYTRLLKIRQEQILEESFDVLRTPRSTTPSELKKPMSVGSRPLLEMVDGYTADDLTNI